MDRAYNLDKRAYSKSMTGLIGISSPYNASVGITRELSYNSNILSTRGYIEPGTDKDLSELNQGNLLTSAELITTFAA